MYLRHGTRILHVIVKVFLFIDQLQKWITVQCSVGQVIPLANKRTLVYFISFQQVCVIYINYCKIIIENCCCFIFQANENHRIPYCNFSEQYITSLNILFERNLKMYIKHIHAYIRSGGTYIFLFHGFCKIESCSYSYFYLIVIVCCISGKKKWMLIFIELLLDIKEVKNV